MTALLTTILGGAATMELVPLCASILSLALDRWATTVNQLQVSAMIEILQDPEIYFQKKKIT